MCINTVIIITINSLPTDSVLTYNSRNSPNFEVEKSFINTH